MCVKFNPCFCCPAEVGVYILSMTHALSITAAFVMGLVLGFETFSLVLEPNLSIFEKSLRLGIFILYVLFFIAEVVMREYLYKTLELNRENKIRRCKIWIRMKLLQLILAIPFIVVHLYLELTELKLTLYIISFIYHIYYTWVVYHYLSFEITIVKPEYACGSSTSSTGRHVGHVLPRIDPGIRLSEIQNHV